MILQVESFIKTKGYSYIAGTIHNGMCYDKPGKTVVFSKDAVTIYSTDDNGDQSEDHILLYKGIDIEKTLTPYV